MAGAKRFLNVFIPILLAVTVFFALFFWFSGITVILPGEPVRLDYENGDVRVHKQLSAEDARRVGEMLGGKLLLWDEPSCGFSQNASLSAGGRTYCIACDTCPVIQDFQSGKYFGISEEEREELDALLKRYGAIFPCV